MNVLLFLSYFLLQCFVKKHNFPIHKSIQQKTPTRSPSQGVDRHRGPVLLRVYQHKIFAKSFFGAGQQYLCRAFAELMNSFKITAERGAGETLQAGKHTMLERYDSAC